MRILLMISVLFLFGCKKDQVRSHIVNVECNNAMTGTDAEARIKLWVSQELSSPSNNIPSLVETVYTDGSGLGQVSFDIIDGRTYWVEVSRIGFFGSAFAFHEDSSFVFWEKLSLEEDQSNVQVNFNPFYSYQLHADNINCSGATDSLWIENPDAILLSNSTNALSPLEAYGCADTSFLLPSNDWAEGFLLSNTSQIDVIITTKKQGVVSTYSETYDLTLGTSPDQISIEY